MASILNGNSQEILEEDTTIARVVWMLPARATLVPVFEGFFEMKLDRVDQLTISSLHHHLVATEIRRREEFEALWYAIELQPVVLPHAQNPRHRLRFSTVDVF